MIIKVCGMTDAENIRQIEQLGVDMIGFIFYPKSPRYLYGIPEYLPQHARRVGVFVNESKENVCVYADRFGLDYIQLHGNEDEDMIRQIQKLTKTEVWKAVRVKDSSDIEKWQDSSADMLLFDTYNKNNFGGTGETFNWQLLKNVKRKFILAGGLNIKNIARAIRTCRPYAVDISSGVETNHIKDAQKIQELMLTIRKVDNHDYK